MSKAIYPVILSSILLVACGGGGGGTSVSVGKFIDDPVQGLTYSCTGGTAPTSGSTNALGEFSFYDGQTCTFKIGNVTLGPAVKVGTDSIITPQDVAGVPRDATNAPSSLAIAQFLQSFNDGSGTGKIVIPQDVHTIMADVPAITLVSSKGVVSQDKLKELVTTVPGKALVTADTAKSQLVKQIESGMVIVAKGSADITKKVLNSIQVTSTVAENAAGLTETFTATGYWSNGESGPLTTGVTWSSSDDTIVKLTDNIGKGLAVGSAEITASFTPEGSTLAVTGSVTQKTTEATITNLVISFVKSGVNTIYVGAQEILQAIATYTNDVTATVSSAVNWTLGNSFASITGGGTANPSVSGVSPGDTSVSAKIGDIVSNLLSFKVENRTLSGVAANGAALANADLEVFDGSGNSVHKTVTDGNGGFTASFSGAAKAPYILKITSGEIVLHAIYGKDSDGEVNITPLSESVAAMLSPSGATRDLVVAAKSNELQANDSLISQKQEVVTKAVGGLLIAVGEEKTDIFNKKFVPNGKGIDKLLDSVAITNVADTANKSANVQITIKTAIDTTSSDTPPPIINLNSSTTADQAVAEKTKVGTINADDLPPDNAAQLYVDLLSNLNTCYLDKSSVRTDQYTTVLSAACKKIFYDNKPENYLNQGQKLGKNLQWAGMFTYDGEVKFLSTDKQYLAQDLKGKMKGDGIGRAIVALSWINEAGNRENIMLYVAKYTLDGKELLGVTGDQNKYGWSISSHNQKREFPLRKDASLDYVTSAFLIQVRDVVPSAGNYKGNSVLKYAKVTAPKKDSTDEAKVFLMAPVAGGASRDLAICLPADFNAQGQLKNIEEIKTYNGGSTGLYRNTCSGISKAITFTQGFVTKRSTAPLLPSDIDNSGIIRPMDSKGVIIDTGPEYAAGISPIGKWKIEYFFVDGTGFNTTTQGTWHVARPMTFNELMGKDGPDSVMPRYKAETMSYLKGLKTDAPVLRTCYAAKWTDPTYGELTCDETQQSIPVPKTGGFKLTWENNGVVPVTSLWAAGSLNDPMKGWITSTGAKRWDDQLTVRSINSSAELLCSKQSSADLHCATGVAVSESGSFDTKSWMSYSELWGKDSEQRSMMRSYNWYEPRDVNKKAL